MPAVEKMQEDMSGIKTQSERYGVSYEDTVSTAIKYFDEWKEQRKEIESLRAKLGESTVESSLHNATKVRDFRVVSVRTEGGEDPTKISKALVENPKVLAIVASTAEGSLKILVARSPDLTVDCRAVLREIAKITGGGGGGKKEFAQGGGGDPSKLQDAFARLPDIVRKLSELSN
jgi:alanyl-tRNA synthetase